MQPILGPTNWKFIDPPLKLTAHPLTIVNRNLTPKKDTQSSSKKKKHNFQNLNLLLLSGSWVPCWYHGTTTVTGLSQSLPNASNLGGFTGWRANPPAPDLHWCHYPLGKFDIDTPNTLQGTNISHLGKRKIIFKSEFWWDILVPKRVRWTWNLKMMVWKMMFLLKLWWFLRFHVNFPEGKQNGHVWKGTHVPIHHFWYPS